MKLVKFDGGLNLAKAQHLIGPTEAILSENVDYESGILKPHKTDTVIASAPNSTVCAYYWFNGPGPYANNWQYETAETEWVDYQNKLYWTKAGLGLFTYNSEDEKTSLTIATPTVQPFPLQIVQAAASPRQIAISSGFIEANVPELAEPFYLPFMDPIAGDWPIATPGQGREYAFVTTVATPGLFDIPSEPQYHTFRKGLDLDNTGYNIEQRLLVATPDPEQPQCPENTPGMELNIYRKVDNRYVFIVSMQNNTSIGPAFSYADNVFNPASPVYLDPVYSLTGTYTYAVSEYDPTTGAESGLYLFDELNLTNSQIWIELNLLPLAKHYKLYRIGGNSTVFTFVTTLTYNPAPAVYFKDTFRDSDLPGPIYTSANKGVPPLTLRYLTELNSVFFAADGADLRFTPPGEPLDWPAFNFLRFPSAITGIGKSSAGLLVFTLYETWLVVGNTPNTLAQVRISGSQGCVKHHSICYTRNACLWFSLEGLCSSSGASIILQTRQRMGKLAYSVVNAALIDEKYYLLKTDGTLFCADFVLSAFSNLTDVTEYTYTWLLLAPKSAADSAIALSVLERSLALRRTASLFTGNTNRSWRYHTGQLNTFGLVQQKVYKQVDVYAAPPFTARAYSKNGLIGSLNQPTGLEDNYRFLIQNENTRGSWVRFEFEGTGQIFEVDFSENSANG